MRPITLSPVLIEKGADLAKALQLKPLDLFVDPAADLVDGRLKDLLLYWTGKSGTRPRSEEHTSELQSRSDLVCRLLLEKKKQQQQINDIDQNTTSLIRQV